MIALQCAEGPSLDPEIRHSFYRNGPIVAALTQRSYHNLKQHCYCAICNSLQSKIASKIFEFLRLALNLPISPRVCVFQMVDAHGSPIKDSSCACCWEDLSVENYVEYRAQADGEWKPSGFCEDCVKMLLQSQWKTYTDGLAKTTCKAEQRRMLEKGPPINVSDKSALPCPDGTEKGNAEVHSLWYMSDGQEHSAQLEGALTGEDRTRYWEEQKAFYIVDEVDDEEVTE